MRASEIWPASCLLQSWGSFHPSLIMEHSVHSSSNIIWGGSIPSSQNVFCHIRTNNTLRRMLLAATRKSFILENTLSNLFVANSCRASLLRLHKVRQHPLNLAEFVQIDFHTLEHLSLYLSLIYLCRRHGCCDATDISPSPSTTEGAPSIVPPLS